MIYDVHQHLTADPGTPQAWRAAMHAAGVQGGALFSRPPAEYSPQDGADFDTRLKEVLAWCEGSEDTDPILFIHPFEPDACAHAREAADRGIAGYKMICNNYSVGDNRALALVSTIAELEKPVFFHSGILWNKGNSSRFNRPAEWEALIDIPRLRFSLAHCSWPWYDECIAVYGKFLNGTMNQSDAPEMFLDLTPGTPEIYRKDLLHKLFHVGYDVPNNILFGSDCYANQYASDWVTHWLAIDNAIYDEMNVPESIRQKIYRDNYLRFIGKTKQTVRRASLGQDSAERWHLPEA